MTLQERVEEYKREYENAIARNDDAEVIADLWLQWQEAEDELNARYLENWD